MDKVCSFVKHKIKTVWFDFEKSKIVNHHSEIKNPYAFKENKIRN